MSPAPAAITVLAASILATACMPASLEPGASRSVGETAFSWVPPGEFELGSRLTPALIQEEYGYAFTEAAMDGWSDQGPLTAVSFDTGFWLASHEVTIGSFRTFTEATGYVTDAESEGWGYSHGEDGFGRVEDISWRAPGWEVSDAHPVSLVSHRDAQAYVAWLSSQIDGRVRLPTEAEWEYAARAGTDTNFAWGDDIAGAATHANVLDSYFGVDDGHPRTAPIGQFAPNAWGLHDMTGNVWEWTSSLYTADYASVPEADSTTYVDRGGAWDSPPYNARIANRGAGDDGFRASNLGIRLVYVPED